MMNTLHPGSCGFGSALCWCVVVFGHVMRAQEPAPVTPGSEQAVAAALAACPGAVLEEVVGKPRSLGLGGADGIWTLRVLVAGVKWTLHVSADGVVMRSSRPVEPKDLPTTVGNGMKKVAAGGAEKITKLETLGVVRFVALASPQVSYVARVRGDAGTMSVTVSGDGTVLDTKKAGEGTAPSVDKNARTEDGPIPELAAKAVKAMREVFPNMVFDLVEEVPYVDSSTQTIVMLWYEVEFFVDGVKHEFNATPDGVVIAYRKAIPADALPSQIAAAIAKAVPGGTVETVTKSETRAGPRIVALESPVVVYEIQPKGEADAKPAPVKLRPDGTEVKEPEWPDWVKKSLAKNRDGDK